MSERERADAAGCTGSWLAEPRRLGLHLAGWAVLALAASSLTARAVLELGRPTWRDTAMTTLLLATFARELWIVSLRRRPLVVIDATTVRVRRPWSRRYLESPIETCVYTPEGKSGRARWTVSRLGSDLVSLHYLGREARHEIGLCLKRRATTGPDGQPGT